jgi:hypothetical protein
MVVEEGKGNGKHGAEEKDILINNMSYVTE